MVGLSLGSHLNGAARQHEPRLFEGAFRITLERGSADPLRDGHARRRSERLMGGEAGELDPPGIGSGRMKRIVVLMD